MEKIHRTYTEYAHDIWYSCEIDTYCEFWKIDKRLNYDYLMNLGDRVCENEKPIENAKEIVENDEVLKLTPFNPLKQEHLIDKNGNYIDNFIYLSTDYSNANIFSDFLFINRNGYTNWGSWYKFKLSIVVPYNESFKSLMYSLYGVYARFDLDEFCFKHNEIKLVTASDDRIYIEDAFHYIPVFYDHNLSINDALYWTTSSTLSFLKKQYLKLKDQENKLINLDQGENNVTKD